MHGEVDRLTTQNLKDKQTSHIDSPHLNEKQQNKIPLPLQTFIFHTPPSDSLKYTGLSSDT